MRTSSSRAKLNRQILDEAAEWFVEMEDENLTAARREAFDEWLRRSPEHVRAFLELLPVWEGAASARLNGVESAERLIAEFPALGAEVVFLRDSLEPRDSPALRHPAELNEGGGSVRRGFRRYLAIAASLALLLVGTLVWRQYERDMYETAIGEQRSIVLDDGSSIELNARSRVRVRFVASERRVELLEGQALFNVARDPDRPFVVISGATRVRAVGTQFDVYRKPQGTVVTVIEGRVAVTSGSDAPASLASGSAPAYPTVELVPGQQVTISASAAPRPENADVAAVTAWTQHRLSFQKTPLAEVVEEFNRYNERQLRIEDEAIEAFLVSGTFSSTNPTSLLRFLRTQPGIEIVETDDTIRIVAHPDDSPAP